MKREDGPKTALMWTAYLFQSKGTGLPPPMNGTGSTVYPYRKKKKINEPLDHITDAFPVSCRSKCES